MAIEIRKAVRTGAKVVLALAGVSGGGKTYSAIQVAMGLAKNDASKIGFLDTENRRGSLYSDILGSNNTFNIGDLIAPFSPSRYIESINDFAKIGIEVLIIDSVSHEWEGEGGCEEIAEANGRINGWRVAKTQHKRFINTLLQAPMHIIVCLRAREKMDFKDSKNPKNLGIQPICEKNFMFEMTASLLMTDSGTKQQVIKCPSALKGILGRGEGYLGAADGLAVREWVDGGAIVTAAERAAQTLSLVCERGIEAYKEAYLSLPAALRNEIGKERHEAMKASAIEYDRQRTEADKNNAQQ